MADCCNNDHEAKSASSILSKLFSKLSDEDADIVARDLAMTKAESESRIPSAEPFQAPSSYDTWNRPGGRPSYREELRFGGGLMSEMDGWTARNLLTRLQVARHRHEARKGLEGPTYRPRGARSGGPRAR